MSDKYITATEIEERLEEFYKTLQPQMDSVIVDDVLPIYLYFLKKKFPNLPLWKEKEYEEQMSNIHDFLRFLISHSDFCDECVVLVISKGSLPDNLCTSCSEKAAPCLIQWLDNLKGEKEL